MRGLAVALSLCASSIGSTLAFSSAARADYLVLAPHPDDDVLIAAGVAGLVWASGLVVFSRDVFSVLEAATESTLTIVAAQARSFLFAALLLTLGLGVWWWVEQEDATV